MSFEKLSEILLCLLLLIFIGIPMWIVLWPPAILQSLHRILRPLAAVVLTVGAYCAFFYCVVLPVVWVADSVKPEVREAILLLEPSMQSSLGLALATLALLGVRTVFNVLKLPFLIAGIPLAVLVMAMGPFFAAANWGAKNAEKKVQTFRSLSAQDFENLILLCTRLNERENIQPGTRMYFGGDDGPPIPAEFQRFGFELLIVAPEVVEGRLYSLFDSVGSVRVRLGSSPSIDLVQVGPQEDVSRIYP